MSQTYLTPASALWLPAGARSVFGGQIAALCLVCFLACAGLKLRCHNQHLSQQAACLTVQEHLQPHSLHCYFLAPTSSDKDLNFEVAQVRDGRSFCTRSVRAYQGGGNVMLLLASFHDSQREAEYSHHCTPPPIIDPCELPSDEQRLLGIMADPRLPLAYKGVLQEHLQHLGPIDVRHARDSDPIMPQGECPAQLVYFKPKLACGSVAEAALAACSRLPELQRNRAAARAHYVASTFASDHMILATAVLPHTWPNPGISMMASLDHSMWFHCEPACDSWVTYELQSHRLNTGRGLASGRLFLLDGVHAASTSQEGLIRFASPGPPVSRLAFPQSALADFDSDGQPNTKTMPHQRQVVVSTSSVWAAQDTIVRPRRAARQQAAEAKL